jgi:Fic family protein
MEIYKPTVQESIEFAKTSSQIEGESSQEAYKDHLIAWEYMRGQHTLTMAVILECHFLLQQTLRPDIAGHIRNCNVRVGGHYPPEPILVLPLLEDWIAEYGSPDIYKDKEDVDGEIRIAHVAFETIHPFEDGNGRVGRIIMNWHRVMNCLPLFIVHPGDENGISNEQKDYYDWFNRDKTNG